MSKRTIAAILIAMIAGAILTACAQKPSKAPASGLESGVSAIEDAMTMPNENDTMISEPMDDLRDGFSKDTTPTPDDFPEAYNYRSGKIADYSRTAMLQKLPEPAGIVWHEDCTFYSRKAIHNHISNVKKKLRTVASEQQCIVSVHGVGYKFDVTQNNE